MLDDNSVRADKLNTVCKVLFDNGIARIIVEFKQVFAVICALDDIGILGLERSCTLSLLQALPKPYP